MYCTTDRYLQEGIDPQGQPPPVQPSADDGNGNNQNLAPNPDHNGVVVVKPLRQGARLPAIPMTDEERAKVRARLRRVRDDMAESNSSERRRGSHMSLLRFSFASREGNNNSVSFFGQHVLQLFHNSSDSTSQRHSPSHRSVRMSRQNSVSGRKKKREEVEGCHVEEDGTGGSGSGETGKLRLKKEGAGAGGGVDGVICCLIVWIGVRGEVTGSARVYEDDYLAPTVCDGRLEFRLLRMVGRGHGVIWTWL